MLFRFLAFALLCPAIVFADDHADDCTKGLVIRPPAESFGQSQDLRRILAVIEGPESVRGYKERLPYTVGQGLPFSDKCGMPRSGSVFASERPCMAFDQKYFTLYSWDRYAVEAAAAYDPFNSWTNGSVFLRFKIGF